MTRELGQSAGVDKICPLGNTTEFEKKLVEAALSELKTNIEKVFFPYFPQK